MIKLAQFIAVYLAKHGYQHVFLLTGGGAMHLNDALGKQTGLEVTYNHHEQASAMAAESYARLTRKPAILNVTTGPGGINALNGVFGAWTDSIPMLVLSGQVRYDTTIEGSGLDLRQMGDQEANIIPMVKGITKYAVMLKDANDIKYHLQKALYLAQHGRPGPVWLDIPINLQGAMIDESQLREFHPEQELDLEPIPDIQDNIIQRVVDKLAKAERPVILAGSAVRSSGGYQAFLTLLDQLNIPVTTAWNAHDVLYDAHPNYVGRPGSVGDRAGNFAVQNADVLLVLGCRLNIRQISYNWQAFAREAYKIVVDIDAKELQKPTVKLDMPIQGDVFRFMQKLSQALTQHGPITKPDWLAWCQVRRQKYPTVLAEYWDAKDSVNPYCFMQALSRQLPENQIVVSANGTACVTSFQAFEIKKGQRLYTNSGCASMGYDLPGAIGACIGSGKQKIICLAGDGSIMQNIQELATIAFLQLPIKIFLMNNQGYHSIRQTQQNFFGVPFVGVGKDSGLGFPDFAKVAEAFGLDFVRCHNHDKLNACIEKTLAGNQPFVCEVMLTLEQQFAPKLSSKRLADGRMVSRPLEDLAPFLSREELAENMIIPMVPEE